MKLILPPGSWHTDAKNFAVIRAEDITSVAQVTARHLSFEQRRAIAAAIAAVPDLLRELTDFHDHTIDQGWHDCDGIPGGCPVAAAIAKATQKE